MTSWHYRKAFLQGVVTFLWQSQRPTENETGWPWLPPGFPWAFNFVPESPCGSNNPSMEPLLTADGLLLPLNQCHLSTDPPSDRWSCYSIQHCYEKNVPTGVIFDQIFMFKTLLEASSLEGYFSFEYQTWNDGMTDGHRPPKVSSRWLLFVLCAYPSEKTLLSVFSFSSVVLASYIFEQKYTNQQK